MLIDAPFPCELGCLRSILWRSPELCVHHCCPSRSDCIENVPNIQKERQLHSHLSNMVIQCDSCFRIFRIFRGDSCPALLSPTIQCTRPGGSNKMNINEGEPRLPKISSEHKWIQGEFGITVAPNSSCGPWNHEHLERFERCIWSIWITVGWCWMLWLTCMNIPKNYGCFLFRSMTVEQKYLDALIGQDPTNNGCADWRHLDV